MADFTFPSNPAVGDRVTSPDGRVWEWDGSRWSVVSTGGGGGPSFTHTQTPAVTDWPIIHNMGFRYVLVQVVDTVGTHVIPDVVYTNTNRVDLEFANPVAGTVIIRR
ncbi:MAG: hypothetical protein C5B60_00060 [Chloroflexi bacterium]|nr:MAG: hypothetical protein C5B60_00060 [Chloroflexota bacterium]